jgi:ornithine cyclodeaminase/alanine dehydrogenase-like protein (mu-crystallin family)
LPYIDVDDRHFRSLVRCVPSCTLIKSILLVQVYEQASHNGELAHAVEAGAVAREDVTELGAVLTGSAPGRRSDDEITCFDSTGLAIQDLAIALAALERSGELDLPMLDL